MSAKHLTGRRLMWPVDSPDAGVISTSFTGSEGHLHPELGWEKGRPGLVPFVSCWPGAYGRLLLTIYVRWRTSLLEVLRRFQC